MSWESPWSQSCRERRACQHTALVMSSLSPSYTFKTRAKVLQGYCRDTVSAGKTSLAGKTRTLLSLSSCFSSTRHSALHSVSLSCVMIADKVCAHLHVARLFCKWCIHVQFCLVSDFFFAYFPGLNFWITFFFIMTWFFHFKHFSLLKDTKGNFTPQWR